VLKGAKGSGMVEKRVLEYLQARLFLNHTVLLSPINESYVISHHMATQEVRSAIFKKKSTNL